MIFKRSRFISACMMCVLVISGCNEMDEEPESEEQQSSQENESDINADLEEENESTESSEDSVEEEGKIDNLEDDIFDSSSTAALVNKQYSLDEGYEPEDLVTVEVPTVLENPEINQLREEASEALSEMFHAAEEEDIELHARSGYRSYQTQVELFESYVSNHGEEAANRYSARPGESEHQTGLAMDITSESVNFQLTEEFGETEEGIWTSENAHEFGFVIRYPEGKEEITGYQYEPWHLRYLGEELATEVFESGLTYEEFLIESGVDIEISE